MSLKAGKEASAIASTCVSLSEASKYSMSNYEANKNTDREAHPAINFKRE